MRRFGVFLIFAAVSGCATADSSRQIPPPVASVEASVEASTATVTETATSSGFLMAESMEPDEPVRFTETVRPLWVETGTVTDSDLPPGEHERIDYWIDFLSGRGQKSFRTWLARTTRYVPLFWAILDRYDLPRDLVFLAMVESGFSTSAYSRAAAVGPWQFMASTGRSYGLRIGFWVDERRDFEIATDAAARHLRDLYAAYGDWFLAMAAYNAGAGKVNRAIRRYGSDDFWILSERPYLRRETKHYIPKIMAAARVSKNPEAFGLTSVEYLPPLDWDVRTTTRSVSLQHLAAACAEVDESQLRALNPALRCGVTPPAESWIVRIPAGLTATCAAALEQALRAEPFVYRYHELRTDDSLAGVARRYRTTPDAILAFNRIEPDQFLDFDEVVVPVPRERAKSVPVRKPPALAYRPATYGPQPVRLVRYRVRSGDSLWRIARRYDVSISDLCRWNGLRRNQVLSIGSRLRIYQGGPRRLAHARSTSRVASPRRDRASGPRPSEHVVRPGESWWSVAHRYQITIESLCRANDMTVDDVLQPGDELRIPRGTEDATRL